MQADQLVKHLDEFEYALDDAAQVYCEGSRLCDIVSQAPGDDLNKTTTLVLQEAIESFKVRSGVSYGGFGLESAVTQEDIKSISLEGFKDFLLRVWNAIKSAFVAMVKRIKEFFFGAEKQAQEIKEDLDKAKKDFKDIEKEIFKADKEATALSVEIDSPSPYLIHKTFYKGSKELLEVSLHDMVANMANYAMTSREHHLLEYVRDFKEDILKLVDSIDTGVAAKDVSSDVFSILNNFLSEKKLSSEQVDNTRKLKDVMAGDEFESEYGNKRYKLHFGISKHGTVSGVDVLKTEQIISKVHVVKNIEMLTITGVEAQDIKHFNNALSDNYTELINYVKIVKEVVGIGGAVQSMISDIENKAVDGIDSKHVVTLSVINKAISAVVKLLAVLQSDVTTVLKEHTDLYLTFNDLFKEQILSQSKD